MQTTSSGIPKRSAVYRVLLLLFLVAAVVSTVQGGRDAIHRSQDFQWNGERVLLRHMDPWAEYLRGDPDNVFSTQVPNYLPILYVLIVPLGFLSLAQAKLVWFLCNIAFAAGSAVLAARFYHLRQHLILILALLFAATPTRISFGNGQQSLFVLLLWSLFLLSSRLTDPRSLGSGISYFKFNFGPPVFFTLFFRGGLRAVLVSAVPSLAATLLVWLWLTGGHNLPILLRILWEPMQVARAGGYSQYADCNLMDVLEFFLQPHLATGAVQAIIFITPIVLCLGLLFCAMRIHRSSSVQWQLAVMATISIGLFRHHFYDAVVLLIPLCYALALWRHWRAKLALGLIAYLWYFQRIVDAIRRDIPYMFIFQFVLLMIVLWAIWGLHRMEPVQEFAVE